MFSAGPSARESTWIGQGFWGVARIRKNWLMSGSCAELLRKTLFWIDCPTLSCPRRASVSVRQGPVLSAGIIAHVEQIVGAVALSASLFRVIVVRRARFALLIGGATQLYVLRRAIATESTQKGERSWGAFKIRRIGQCRALAFHSCGALHIGSTARHSLVHAGLKSAVPKAPVLSAGI